MQPDDAPLDDHTDASEFGGVPGMRPRSLTASDKLRAIYAIDPMDSTTTPPKDDSDE